MFCLAFKTSGRPLNHTFVPKTRQIELAPEEHFRCLQVVFGIQFESALKESHSIDLRIGGTRKERSDSLVDTKFHQFHEKVRKPHLQHWEQSEPVEHPL